MGYKEIDIALPTSYSDDQLKQAVTKSLRVKEFTFQVINKSLDARKKNSICWRLRVGVSSPHLKGTTPLEKDAIDIPYKPRNKKVVITGSGPAGFFAAYVLQMAGYDTVLIERGSDVDKRARGIHQFEKDGLFNPLGNYAFGEGGAGTFSDGKLTARSKRVSREKAFILQHYIAAGGPDEIAYMTHPHLGTDNLKKIVRNLREEYRRMGGTLLFETLLTGLATGEGKVTAAITAGGEIVGDYFFIAPGHSAYETYRMLMRSGVPFRTKNFALGSRAEHPQEIINQAQWGRPALAGVKAAEYRLTSPADGKHQVYTFCMCPGGMVVPATAYEHTNIVNGMSYYQRNGKFANAACVATLHPDQLAGRTISPAETLDEIEKLERRFHAFAGGYSAPFCTIADFVAGKQTLTQAASSYPLGLVPAQLWEMLPPMVVNAMRKGLADFNKKLKGYDQGILLGLESKTSSPIQVIRGENGLTEGFSNLFIVGEGSGYAGGIMSSAADGIRTALGLI
jgi:uncharacterized FAD-dependent dehydrogenase